MEGTVEEILEVLKLKETTVIQAPAEKIQQRGPWSPARRAAQAKRMTESWANRKKATRKPYSRHAPVWSVVNRSKILPPPLTEIGCTFKRAWAKEKILEKLAVPHNGDFTKADAEFVALVASNTLLETKNGRWRAPFGATRMV